MIKLGQEEYVARLLKPIWVSRGKVSADAFALRPRLKEDYISVLREQHPNFLVDLNVVCKSSLDCTFSKLKVGDICQLKVPELKPNIIDFSVFEVNAKKIKSHAGIFVSVNGEKVIGGEPLSTFVKCGKAQNGAFLLLQLKLAKLAEKSIHRLLLDYSLGKGMASERNPNLG